jgi:DNA mismatch endonuclease, patch repair protein
MDTISKNRRRGVMRRIRKTDTRPELRVRKLLRAMGYQFRLYGKELPGNPDIVFRQRRKAIFVNGCFWHQHRGCRLARQPKSNLDYWIPKLKGNCRRDTNVRHKLTRSKWSYLTVWECQLSDLASLEGRLNRYLQR